MSNKKLPSNSEEPTKSNDQKAKESIQHESSVPQSQIGEFEILRQIGRGGMGTVYEAYQKSMHRKVALKILDSPALLSTQEVARFEREAWIGGRLSHPNIVKVYSQGAEGTTHYIAMEFVEGQSVRETIRDVRKRRAEKPEPDSQWRRGHVRRMVELFAGLADALQHVHEQGIVHRDIKPGNLLLTKDGRRLLLTDFGLARDADASRMTRRGDFLGTIRYMSPEQLLAHRAKVDHRTDIWSLGVSLFEAVTLDLPFDADSEEAYISAVSSKEPFLARRRDRAVPRDLETILMKCLARNPEERFTSAADLRDDLLRFLRDEPVLAKRPGVMRRALRVARRYRRALGIILLAVIATVSVTVIWERHQQHQRDLLLVKETLESAIAVRKTAYEITPDWDRLKGVVKEELKWVPTGDVAAVARRAAVLIIPTPPRFPLLSRRPRLCLEFENAMNSDGSLWTGNFEAIPFNVTVESSWDKGPWTKILENPRPSDYVGSVEFVPLQSAVKRERLTTGPHQMELRASIAWLDPDRFAGRTRDGKGTAPTEIEIQREERELPTLYFSLFEEYPPNFPVRVHVDPAAHPVFSWFPLDSIRIVRPKGLRGGQGSITWPWGACFSLSGDNRVVVILHFLKDAEPPASMSGELRILAEGRNTPLVRSPFPFNASEDEDAFAVLAMAADEPARPNEIGGFSGTYFIGNGEKGGREIWLGDREGTLPLPSEMPDGTFRGRFVFEPSRDAAISTGLAEFLDERIEIPVTIEILSKDVDPPEGNEGGKGD